MSSRLSILCLLPAALCVLSGCWAGPGILYKPAEVKLAGDDVLLVVPFSDPAMGCFESRNGRELANSIVASLKANAPKIKAISGGRFRRSIEDADYETVTPADKAANRHPLSRIADEIRATRVLEGKIIELEDHPPRSPNIMRGKMVVKFTLRDPNAWEPPLGSWNETYIFPEDPNRIISSQEMTPMKILAEIVILSGRRIAEKFYGHERMKGDLLQ